MHNYMDFRIDDLLSGFEKTYSILSTKTKKQTRIDKLNKILGIN